jgi:DNA-binding transcriptional ArsR family regulator
VSARIVEPVVAEIAACIGEPARARMLYSLLDGRSRTSTELALIGGVTPSTASVHLGRLKECGLVRAMAQGKHRYYRLGDAQVAAALEALSVVAGGQDPFKPNTPRELREARTCYDHMAGAAAVALHDRMHELGWLESSRVAGDAYEVTLCGEAMLGSLGVDIAALRQSRRRLAYACVDWSERRPHIGGALGAQLLSLALKRRWVLPHRDERRLSVTPLGRRAFKLETGV